MKVIIIQFATGNKEQLRRLEISSKAWSFLAKHFDCEYHAFTDWSCHDDYPGRPPHWEKIARLIYFGRRNPDTVRLVWADSDTLPVRLVDPRTQLVRHIAMVERNFAPVEYNSGVIMMHPTMKMISVLSNAMRKGKLNYTHDQSRLTAELKNQDVKVDDLHVDWNDYEFGHTRSLQPIVKAWHGYSGEEPLSELMQREFASSMMGKIPA